MEKTRRSIGVIVALIMVLSVGGTLFSYLNGFDGDSVAGSAYAASDSTTLKKKITTKDKNNYQFTVTYSESSGIPENAELVVSEIRNKTDYNDYLDRSVEEIETSSDDVVNEVQFAKAFDIKLRDPATGDEYQPNDNVKVSIRLVDDNMNDADRVGVVHFAEEEGEDGDTPALLDADIRRDSVIFETDGFSVYVVVGYTVDFHDGDKVYSIEGGTTIFLSELIDILGIEDFTIDDVKSVEFSDPELIQVDEVTVTDEESKVVETATTERIIEKSSKDWRLVSLKSFTSNETLYVTLQDGKVYEVPVTDEIYGDDPGETVTRVTNTRVTASGVTYNLNNTDNTATVYAIANNSKFYDKIVYSGKTYLVTDIRRTVGQLTSNKSDIDYDLTTRIAGTKVELPAVLTEPSAEDMPDPSYTAGTKNNGDYKIWKKATYNESTNSVDYEIKYFQAMKKNLPIDFIFIYDDSASMYSGTQTSNGVSLREAQITRVVVLNATKELLEGQHKDDYDINVYFGGASSGDKRVSDKFNEGQYQKAAEYMSAYHTGTTNHDTGVANALTQARKSVAAGRNPVVIYISDFHQYGTLTTNSANVRALHNIAQVYGLSTDYDYGHGKAATDIPAGEDYMKFMRNGNIKEGVEAVDYIIEDAIGYYIKNKVTVTDNLSDALGEYTATAGSASTGTTEGGTGKNTWTIGGSTVGAGKVYTEKFSVKLKDDTVYAGAMPTNDEATVKIGGKEVNKINPSSTTPTDNLHLAKGVLFLFGKLNENDTTDGKKDANGAPNDSVDGIKFTLTKQGEATPVREFTTSNGGFTVPFTDNNGVVLELGKKYELKEDKTSVDAYNAGNPSTDTDLDMPDSYWILEVGENGVIVTSVEDRNAAKTPKLTVSKSRFVIWNQIVVKPTLIPITISKTWDANQTNHRDSVPFTVYGINPDNGKRTALRAYSNGDDDLSDQIRYLKQSECTVSGDTWSRTVWVYDSIKENDQTIYFTSQEGILDKSVLDNPGHTFKVNNDTVLTADNWSDYVNYNNNTIRYGQTYSYAIEEGNLVYDDGWYTPKYGQNTTNDEIEETYNEEEKWIDPPADWLPLQLHINVNNFVLRQNISYFIGLVNDYGTYPGGRMIVEQNLYRHVEKVELTVKDHTDNSELTVTFHPQSAGSYNFGHLYQDIMLPKEWSSYATHGSTAHNVHNLEVTKLTFTDDIGNVIDIYGGDTGNILPHGPEVNSTSIYALAIETNRANEAAHTRASVDNQKVFVPASHTETDYSLNNYTLSIDNTWNDNELIKTRVVKNWMDINDEGTPEPYGEDKYDVKDDVEYSIKGSVGGTKKTVPIYDSHNWETGLVGDKDTISKGRQDVNASTWTKTIYLPKYDTSTYDRTKDTDSDPSTEACEPYTYDNNSIVETKLNDPEYVDPDTGDKWKRGEWSDPTYSFGQSWQQSNEYKDAYIILPRTSVEASSAYKNINRLGLFYTGSDGTLYETEANLSNVDLSVRNRMYYLKIKVPADEDVSNLQLVHGEVRANGTYNVITLSEHGANPFNNSWGAIYYGVCTRTSGGSYGMPAFKQKGTTDPHSINDSFDNIEFTSTKPTSGTDVSGESTLKESVSHAFAITNTYTPYKEVKLNAVFHDLSDDKSSTKDIKKVYYTIKKGSDVVRAVEAAISEKTDQVKLTAAEKIIYLKPDTYTITQSYTLDEGEDAKQYILDGSLDAYKVDWTDAIKDGETTSKQDTPVYGATKVDKDRTLTFSNTRKTLPVQVKMSWEPSLQTNEDPLRDSGIPLKYTISYEKSDRTVVERSNGNYKQKEGTGSWTDKTDADFELSKSRHINEHASASGGIPSNSVREMPTEVKLDSKNMKDALKDYELSVNSEEKTEGSTKKQIFTIRANIKRAAVIVEKSWGDRVEDEDKEGVALTYTIKRSDGKNIYGTGTKEIKMHMTMPSPASKIPEKSTGTFVVQNQSIQTYRSGLDSATKETYDASDTIYLPILRSSSEDQGVKYILTETASKNGAEKKYYVTFASESGVAEDEFEEANKRGKNVEEAGNPANAGKFRLNTGGIIIAVVNGGNSFQNVAFMKIDNNGNPLNGAEFTLFDDKACSTETQAVSDNKVKSKTQQAVVNGAKRKSHRGIVDFGEVQSGIYFMKETDAPSGYRGNSRFVVVVGRDYMDINVLKNEDSTVFANITQADLDAQNDAQLRSSMTDAQKDEARKYYAIFEMSGGKADPDSDIVNYAVMNEARGTRKVIARKTTSGYTPLSGAEFTIYNYNMTEREDTAASMSSGVFYIGELPYGTYYLKETSAPSGYAGNKGKYFKLTVSKDGATVGKGVKNLVRQKYVVYTTEGYNPEMNDAVVDPAKAEYEVDETVQLSVTVDGVTLSTSEYGSKFNLTTFGGNVDFGEDNNGITFLDPGEITLMIELKEDLSVGGKTIKAGTTGTVTVNVKEHEQDDDQNPDNNSGDNTGGGGNEQNP